MARHASETETPATGRTSTTTTADEWLTMPPPSRTRGGPGVHPGRSQAPDDGPPRRRQPTVPDERARAGVAASNRGPSSIVVAPAARTSAAAAVALALGVAALLATASLLLAPLGVVLGAGALVLGIVGTGRAGLPHLTGRGVAVGAIMAGASGMLLGMVMLAGGLTFLAEQGNVEIEHPLGDVRVEVAR